MYYLYHQVPQDMRGNILYPLNELKNIFPDLYENKLLKYKGREFVMKQKIPVLNCFWNDVLHLSPVHPKDIKDNLIKAGRNPNFNMNFYVIDPKFLDRDKAVVYLNKHINSSDKLKIENFEPYDPDRVFLFSNFPEETRKYYKDVFDQKGNLLLFHKIPHILYKGKLNIEKLPIITV